MISQPALQHQEIPVETIPEYDPITLRYELGITLERLAEILDVSVTTACRWSNRSRNPSKYHRIRAYLIRNSLINRGLLED